MSVVFLGVETVIAQVVTVAYFTFESWPFKKIKLVQNKTPASKIFLTSDWLNATAIASHALVARRHHLHLGEQPGPVLLLGEIHGDVVAVGRDSGHDADAVVRHVAPFVPGRRDGRFDAHLVPHFDGGGCGHRRRKAQQLDVDEAHPVSAHFVLPVYL